jgi:hypothetical protein
MRAQITAFASRLHMEERRRCSRHVDVQDGAWRPQPDPGVRNHHATRAKLTGIEYVTWDEDTQTLRSHLMADDGCNFTYTHQVDDDGTCWSWFGDKGAANFFKGRLSEDGRTITGRWQWPGGGFDVVSRKVGE